MNQIELKYRKLNSQAVIKESVGNVITVSFSRSSTTIGPNEVLTLLSDVEFKWPDSYKLLTLDYVVNDLTFLHAVVKDNKETGWKRIGLKFVNHTGERKNLTNSMTWLNRFVVVEAVNCVLTPEPSNEVQNLNIGL